MIHQAPIDEARYLLELLGNIARVTFFRADDTCHHVEADEYKVPAEAVDDIEKALSACDHLPEPEEGLISEGYSRAVRRLKQLLGEFEAQTEQLAELETQAAQLSARLIESDVERDKLAAHMERAHSVIKACEEAEHYRQGPWPKHIEQWMAWHRDTPTTSLTRRDAAVRLEFAREAARRHGGLSSIIEIAESINHWQSVEQKAAKRRQADAEEGGAA